MTLDTTIDEGELGHILAHETLADRYNDGEDILSDVFANRPLATAVEAGTLFWATDTNVLYRSDGATWSALAAGVTDHGALTGLLDDDHTQYRLESADHTHQSTGLQGGTLDHGLALTGLTDDDHTIYLKEKASGGTAAEVPTHTHQAAGEAGTLDHGLALTGLTDDDHTQYILKSLLAAKGAIIAATAASTPAGLAVGANGTVLTADSAESTGIKWATPAGGATFVYKTADETVSASTTLQDDNHLTFTIDANGIYAFEAYLYATHTTSGDLKIMWVEPDGTYSLFHIGHQSGGAWSGRNMIESEASGFTFNLSSSVAGVVISGKIVAGGAGGTFKLQWAQASASGDTVMKTGSWLSYKKLN
jgi:hypothetical protein